MAIFLQAMTGTFLLKKINKQVIKIVQPKNDRQIEISLHEKLPMVEGGLIEATKAQSNEQNSIKNLCYTGLRAL